MKTGRPHHYLPSPSTVGRDVHQVFVRVRRWIANLLRVSLVSILIMSIVTKYWYTYEGHLSFATDAWTSPNHHAYVAFSVHFIHDNEPISLLLDFIEVATVCSPFVIWLCFLTSV
jgi:hypothetical protein